MNGIKKSMNGGLGVVFSRFFHHGCISLSVMVYIMAHLLIICWFKVYGSLLLTWRA